MTKNHDDLKKDLGNLFIEFDDLTNKINALADIKNDNPLISATYDFREKILTAIKELLDFKKEIDNLDFQAKINLLQALLAFDKNNSDGLVTTIWLRLCLIMMEHALEEPSPKITTNPTSEEINKLKYKDFEEMIQQSADDLKQHRLRESCRQRELP